MRNINLVSSNIEVFRSELKQHNTVSDYYFLMAGGSITIEIDGKNFDCEVNTSGSFHHDNISLPTNDLNIEVDSFLGEIWEKGEGVIADDLEDELHWQNAAILLNDEELTKVYSLLVDAMHDLQQEINEERKLLEG